jgi:DNA modification methylase
MEFDNATLFEVEKAPPVTLADKFLIPPFSVLDRRSDAWQSRKRRWLSLGIKSEMGREEGLTYGSLLDKSYMEGFDDLASTSVFDPMLCEVAYRWFSPSGGEVLDPFAGGSVRGVVASHLGRNYTGIELRPEQVAANKEQLNICLPESTPIWLEGDSRTVRRTDREYDFVFTCPPYADLEVYSDDPRDLSTLPYPVFILEYKECLQNAYNQLANDRFFAIVISDVRSKRNDGAYYGLVTDTVNVMREIGAELYNDLVLIDPVGTLAVRSGKIMASSRKVGRGHQHMLVFVKGDGKKAAKNCGEMEQL